jgi:acyl-CoA synthetase (AMP-forming)/AMP-acid ligase II
MSGKTPSRGRKSSSHILTPSGLAEIDEPPKLFVNLPPAFALGRPVPGIEVDIRSADGRSLPAGERGLVWVRGSQVSGEYTEQGSVLDEDGWFPAADAGYPDEGGYLFIQGRTDDTIIRGGENIAPDEIESVLVQHPLVRDVAVVGTPDEEWGERIAAVVVPVDDALLTPDEVRIFVRERLRGSRTPDDVVITDQLPYSPTGKLLRRELVSRLTADAADRLAVL